METKLHPANNKGIFAGFKTMLRIESSSWLSPKALLIQSIIWSLSAQFVPVLVLVILPATESVAEIVTLNMAVDLFFSIFSMVVAIGVIILMQSVLVGEKQSGTAAWILTNPITRVSFILSKMVANTVNILLMTIILQGIIGYGVLSYSLGYMLPINAFLVSMGIQTIHMLFYISLTMALGSFFNSRGPILGIAIAFIMLQDFLAGLIGRYIAWFPYALPNMLNTYSKMVNLGQATPTILPIISAMVYSLVLLGLSIWRFNNTEF